MDEAEVRDLERALTREEVVAGATVFRQGDPGDHLVLITRGRAGVVESARSGPLLLLALKAGRFVGESGCWTGARGRPRSPPRRRS